MKSFSARNTVSPCPKRIRPLIEPVFKNNFSTNFQGIGPWEGPVHFSIGLPSRFTIAAFFSRADPGPKRRTKRLFQKQLQSSKRNPFPKVSDRLLNNDSRTVFQQISKALGHERAQFALVGFSGFTIAAFFPRADPRAMRKTKSLFQKQLQSSKRKPFPKVSDRLLNNDSRTVFQQISKALGHERAQFALVGLFSGFRIAAFFPELILEPREGRKTYTHFFLFLLIFLSLFPFLYLPVSLLLPLLLPLLFSLPVSLLLLLFLLLLLLPLSLSRFFLSLSLITLWKNNAEQVTQSTCNEVLQALQVPQISQVHGQKQF